MVMAMMRIFLSMGERRGLLPVAGVGTRISGGGGGVITGGMDGSDSTGVST